MPLDRKVLLWEEIGNYIEGIKNINIPLGKKITFGDKDTTLYEGFDDYLYVQIGGVDRWIFHDQYLRSVGGGGAGIFRGGATSTFPSILPKYSDINTGVGHGGNDALSLIAGGVEGVRVSEVGGVITTKIKGLRMFADNAAAISAGLTEGDIFSDYEGYLMAVWI